MDAIEKLVFECEVSAAVLGKGEEFVFARLPDVPEAVTAYARERGFRYCGVVGAKAGRIELELASLDPENVKMMAFAVAEFAKCKEASPVLDGDSADWLERLHRLPDTRES